MALFNPGHWRDALVARVKPLLANVYEAGWRALRKIIPAPQLAFVEPVPFVVQPSPKMSPLLTGVQEAVRFVEERAYAFADSTNATTTMRLDEAYRQFRSALSRGVQERQSVQRLTEEVLRIFRDPVRAKRIAVTETARAHHAGEYEVAKRAGVREKRWLSAKGACELCRDLDGIVKPLAEPFIVIPRAEPQYAVVQYPPSHPHCLCRWEIVV